MSAQDVATGKERSVRIEGPTRLREAEKERIVAEAQCYAEEDSKRREQADRLNNADATCYQGEHFLADFGDKISSDVRARIEVHLRDVKAAGKDGDAAGAHADELAKVLQEAGSSICTEASAGERAPSDAGPDGVVDAAYTESKA